jgi:MFS family permease
VATAAQLDPEARSRLTFSRDRVRGVCAGLVDTGVFTFGLVIAIRCFHAPPSVKALLSGANAIGLLLTPLSLFAYTRFGWNAARAAALNFGLGGVCFCAAAFAPSIWVYVPAAALGSVFVAQQAPLLIHIYTQNYASHVRGHMLSNSIVLGLIASVGFALLGGRMLDWRLETFRVILGAMALAAFVAARATAGMPADPFTPGRSSNPFAAMRYAWQDRIFGWMLFVWMLMGIGNLMVLPLRVEYMANPRFGINATNAQIALISGIIPSLVRIASTHFWGRLFDRHNFFVIRTVLNGVFLLAILVFFSTRDLIVLGIAAGLFGFALAGGNIAWNLWVTKFAPPERTSDYMSVHTFLTGIRGVGAPFLGFWLIARTGPMTTGLCAAVLIALSMVLLGPLRRRHAMPAAT